MKIKNVFIFIAAVAICFLPAILAGLIGQPPGTWDWYKTLNKPSFNPPNWIFGPVWTLLYFLMGVSLYLITKNGLKTSNFKKAVLCFATQLVFNALWMPAFFYLHNPLLGLIDIIFLWISIVLTVTVSYKINKTASILLWPYLVWTTFAGVLNFALYILNK